MRSYKIDINRIVNQLVPHYLGGRKLILFLEALLHPLGSIGKEWTEWAVNTMVDASMTSQTILFEHYLNSRFRQYFLDGDAKLAIADSKVSGTALYWEEFKEAPKIAFYKENENAGKNNFKFYWQNEEAPDESFSFIVNCPSPNEDAISKDELTAMLAYQIKKYCLAGKKFNINYI